MIDWNRASWQLENMVEDTMDTSAVCQMPKTEDILFPKARTFADLRLLCKKLQGEITSVNAETQPGIIDIYRKHIPNPKGGKSKLK